MEFLIRVSTQSDSCPINNQLRSPSYNPEDRNLDHPADLIDIPSIIFDPPKGVPEDVS